jgi:ubiquinone/menaquinone biosynthesis C-methylase UbiE
MNETSELIKLFSTEKAAAVNHLDSALGVGRYIRIADLVKDRLRAGQILDWGCGFGQMTYLLKNRGLQVVSYEIDDRGRSFLEKIGQQLILATDPVKLPFPPASFEAVLSCGVLEHVTDAPGSLREIERVLKPGGYFFIYMLPNRYSYIEFLSDRLGRGDHEVKYSLKEIRGILDRLGFEVVSTGYKGLLPYNCKGLPQFLKKYYHLFDGLIWKLDGLLSRWPVVRLISTNLEIVARKKNRT